MNSGEASPRGSGNLTSTSTTNPVRDTDTAAKQTQFGATIVGEIPDGPLQPGRYALPPVGPLNEPFAVVDVPAGYSSWHSFIEADEPVEPGDPLMIALWVITGVYMNPCTESNEVPARSVRATAGALVQQKLTSASKPRPVVLAGHHGLYVQVTTPMDLDYATCSDGEVTLWEGRPDAGYWTVMPGMVNRLWILNIGGQTMAIHMAVPPSATPSQIKEMTTVVESATFVTS